MEQFQDFENESPQSQTQSQGKWLLPVSILVAGITIAGAVVYSTGKNALQQEAVNSGKASAQRESPPPTFGSGSAENIKPITTSDHTLGNPDAPVKIVEFADAECPFCKRFHPTMQQLIQEYGRNGQVAWIYRHFPLDQIHSKARKEAQAAECANELGGNAKFWQYTNRLYEIAPSNNNLDLSLLSKIAEEVGLNKTQFESCLSGDGRGGKYADHIEADYQDAIASGGTGTPYSVVIAPNGQKFPITGAQPYSAVKQVVDAALNLK
jgi:protein-disulfide isomerase